MNQKLYGTQVTSQDINELRKALPNCEIVWDAQDPPKTN